MNINEEGFFYIPKELIRSGEFRDAKQANRSIIPILHLFGFGKGSCYPKLKTIADLCGFNENTIGRNIESLNKIPSYSSYKTRMKGGYLKYSFILPKNEKGCTDKIRIDNVLIKDFTWANMSKVARACYIGLRYFAKADQSIMEYLDDVMDEDEVKEKYRERRYDILEFLNKNELSRITGISRKNINIGIKELIDIGLAEEDHGIINISIGKHRFKFEDEGDEW